MNNEPRWRNPCIGCGFWEPDYESCACPSSDMWYACPIESAKEENQKALIEYAEQRDRERR